MAPTIRVARYFKQQHCLYIAISLPVSEYPSCLQTTLASGVPQESSQTVPQLLFKQTSTRPSKLLLPPISLTSPSVHANTKTKLPMQIYTQAHIMTVLQICPHAHYAYTSM